MLGPLNGDQNDGQTAQLTFREGRRYSLVSVSRRLGRHLIFQDKQWVARKGQFITKHTIRLSPGCYFPRPKTDQASQLISRGPAGGSAALSTILRHLGATNDFTPSPSVLSTSRQLAQCPTCGQVHNEQLSEQSIRRQNKMLLVTNKSALCEK